MFVRLFPFLLDLASQGCQHFNICIWVERPHWPPVLSKSRISEPFAGTLNQQYSKVYESIFEYRGHISQHEDAELSPCGAHGCFHLCGQSLLHQFDI